jgi:hypothetical protein
MRKFQLFGIALLAMCGFSALLSASAFAELTFATAKWLANGVAVAAELATQSTGGILFVEPSTKVEILCQGIFDGTVGASGADSVTAVLTLPGVLVPELDESGATGGIACTNDETAGTLCEGTPEAYPRGLPFLTVLMLDTENGLFYDLVLNAEYAVLCRVLLVNVVTLCLSPPNGLSWFEVLNLATDVEAMGKVEPSEPCGELFFDEGNLTFLVNGGESLQASE